MSWYFGVVYITFVSMKENNSKWENIKIEKKILNKVRSHKKKTGISLMAFTKQAILEKLERANQSNVYVLKPTD